MAKIDLDSFSVEERAACATTPPTKSAMRSRAKRAKLIAKAALKKTPDAGAVERSPAYRSGNPIGRAYNGRGMMLDSHK
jgi:hypothetical protein